MDNTELRPEFVEQVERVRNKVYSTVKCKKINNRPLNGGLLVSLIKSYTEAINGGMIPSVESAWYYVCRNEGLRALQDANRFL